MTLEDQNPVGDSNTIHDIETSQTSSRPKYDDFLVNITTQLTLCLNTGDGEDTPKTLHEILSNLDGASWKKASHDK